MGAENVCSIPANNTPAVATSGKTHLVQDINGREAVILGLENGVQVQV